MFWIFCLILVVNIIILTVVADLLYRSIAKLSEPITVNIMLEDQKVEIVRGTVEAKTEDTAFFEEDSTAEEIEEYKRETGPQSGLLGAVNNFFKRK